MAKLIFSHENTKEKAQKLAEKRNIAYFAEKKDGKGNISLSVISHKSCNNS
uniref:hypothetical protein n=1 Tax=Segatella copri TaxID=165179 RepID=UPI00356729C9